MGIQTRLLAIKYRGLIGLVLVLSLIFGLSWIVTLHEAPHAETARGPASLNVEDPKFTVVVRKKSGKAELSEVEIPELAGKPAFENENIKIVLGRSNVAIPINVGIDSSDEKLKELRIKAANVFYHTLIARKYFTDVLHSEEVKNLPQVTLRLEMDDNFSELGHYLNKNTDRVYNNSGGIPSGKPFKVRPCKPGDYETWDHPYDYCGESAWGLETWYRPMKSINTAEMMAAMPVDPMKPTIDLARQVLYPFEGEYAVRDFVVWLNSSKPVIGELISPLWGVGKTILYAELGFEAVKGLNRLFVPHHFWIDSAMVPEIVYHEFTHLALSSRVSIRSSSPLNEGVADFFGARIANNPSIGAHIGKYLKGRPHNGKKKHTQYQLSYEQYNSSSSADLSDFTLSFLWHMGDVLTPEKATELVYEARYLLNPEKTDLYSGFTDALIKACWGVAPAKQVCDVPERDALKLSEYFRSRGL